MTEEQLREENVRLKDKLYEQQSKRIGSNEKSIEQIREYSEQRDRQIETQIAGLRESVMNVGKAVEAHLSGCAELNKSVDRRLSLTFWLVGMTLVGVLGTLANFWFQAVSK